MPIEIDAGWNERCLSGWHRTTRGTAPATSDTEKEERRAASTSP